MSKNVVKIIAACIVALSLTSFLVLPATAVLERPSTEVECRAAGMRWVQQTGKCRQVKQITGNETLLS